MGHTFHWTAITSAVVALFLCFTSKVDAQNAQLLSALSVVSWQKEPGALTIDTSSQAKIRISFQNRDIVRVQVAPTGAFNVAPSFVVLRQTTLRIVTKVVDLPDELVFEDSDMAVHVRKTGISLAIFGEGGKTLLTEDNPSGGVRWDPSGSVGQAISLAPDERIYGLGEDNRNGGTLNRRGTVCDLVTGQQINSGNVTAEDPVPFYLSTGRDGHGYGVYVDNTWRMRFDLGKTASDVLDWSAPGGPIDYYVIDGPSFKSIVESFADLTGHPAMLPLWAFGYWQSKCTYVSFDEMHSVADKLRADGIPVDVMVIDSFWLAHYVDYTWAGSWVKPGITIAQQIAKLHADNLRIILSVKGPMDREDSPNYQSGWDAGVFATDGHGRPVTCGYYGGDLLDFSNPKISDWLWPQLQPLHDEGIDGWWLDLIEPEGAPFSTVFYAGSSDAVRNTFPTRVISNFYEFQKNAAPTSRPVLLGRAGSAGEQRYGGILWTGDTNSDWPTFRAQIPEAQNSGLSGLAWWTNDSGGFLSGFYKNDQYGADAQLYARWLEFSAFAPIARAHKAGPPEPFDYGPVAVSAAHKYLSLRYRLMPYIYSCAYETHRTGLPLLRPLVLDYQRDVTAGETKDEFLFGPNILVAPVDEEDAVSRAVYLPAGDWFGLEDGKHYSGGKSFNVRAPYDTIPLFVKAGAIIPMAPSMLSTVEKPWDLLTIDVYPYRDSKFTMFADDGVSTSFERGAFTSTLFSCHEEAGKKIVFTISESNKLFAPARWIVRFRLSASPRRVKVDGNLRKSDTTAYDPVTGIEELRFRNGSATLHKVEVVL
jgi:alpha-glucosidase